MKATFGCALVLLALQLAAAVEPIAPTTYQPWDPTAGTLKGRPLVIAHRGSSGNLPEHTLPAYKRAIAEGADCIECDVVVTKDQKLVCRHEPMLELTTDAMDKFPDRVKTYNLPEAGGNVTGIFVNDLTLAEVQTLRARQIWQFRDHSNDNKWHVPIFQEYVAVAQDPSNNRPVCIYPETKHPTFFNNLPANKAKGVTIDNLLLAELKRLNYSGPLNSPHWLEKPVYIQSFEQNNLRWWKNNSNFPVVQLIDDVPAVDTNNTPEYLLSEAGIKEISTYATGYAPWKGLYVIVNATTGYIEKIDPNPIRLAAKYGMPTTLWTLRNERQYLAYDFQIDPFNEYDLFFNKLGAKGGFTDFPGTLVAWQSYQAVLKSPDANNITSEKLANNRPWVIAHRGFSTAYPEHTKLAWSKAIEAGADFVECDVVLTKDRVPICRHEPNMNGTTDVFKKFPDRVRTYNVDGVNETGIFSVDLTLAEIKTLRCVERLPTRGGSKYDGQEEVPTFDEYLKLLASAERAVGAYPETKHPTWHNALPFMTGHDMNDIVLDVLTKNGYKGNMSTASWQAKPVFIQSFEFGNLKYLAGKTDLPLVLLHRATNPPSPHTFGGKSGREVTTDADLDEYAKYVQGIGPDKNLLLPTNASGNGSIITGFYDLVERVHKRGMQVHPWTARPESPQFLPYQYAADIRNGEQRRAVFVRCAGVANGIQAKFPDVCMFL